MSLQFICPSCGWKELESVETNVTVGSIITNIDESGDFGYGDQNYCDGGYVDRFQCAKCGHILRNENDEPVNENMEAVEWVKKHCS